MFPRCVHTLHMPTLCVKGSLTKYHIASNMIIKVHFVPVGGECRANLETQPKHGQVIILHLHTIYRNKYMSPKLCLQNGWIYYSHFFGKWSLIMTLFLFVLMSRFAPAAAAAAAAWPKQTSAAHWGQSRYFMSSLIRTPPSQLLVKTQVGMFVLTNSPSSRCVRNISRCNW